MTTDQGVLVDKLARWLTDDQFERMLELLDRVDRSGGYGDVTLVIERSRVRFYRLTLSIDNAPEEVRHGQRR